MNNFFKISALLLVIAILTVTSSITVHAVILKGIVLIEEEEAADAVDFSQLIEESQDIDPFSILDDSYVNPDDYIFKDADKILKYKEFLELNVPFVFHDRKINLTYDARQILEKVVYEEARYCPFEQQVAIAALILNRLFADEYPDTIFEIVSAPNQFRESYAYAPFPEISAKTKAAVDCALEGIDFSCGAVCYYNPEYSSKEGIDYFEAKTTMCGHIVDKMNLVLCCLNEHSSDTLKMQKFIYSNELDATVIY